MFFNLKYQSMNKKFIFILAFVLAVISVSAQKNQVKILSENAGETVVSFTFSDYQFHKIGTSKGDAYSVTAEKLSQLAVAGAPDVPKFTTSLIIPDLDNMKTEVISSKYQDFNNGMLVAPSKGTFSRELDPASVPYIFGKQYEKNEFFPGILTDFNQPYIVRDYRGMAVFAYPVQYNPVTGTVRIYSEIVVKISSDGQNGKNQFVRKSKPKSIEKEFNEIYKNHFLNYDEISKYTPLEETGKMLIVCYDAWVSNVQPLVDWKNKIGRPTEIITVTQAGGTAAAIKTYVQNYYNTNGLTYLLLVGDAAQIPTNSGTGLGGYSDNAYGYVTGSDHYQEFFVGRFSAETAEQVNTQVLRSIQYEQGDQLTSGWLNKTVGIGSDQGPGDDNEYDYQHQRNIQTKLIGYTYTTPTIELFDGSQGGNDDAGNPTSATVATAVNNGCGILTYTGHGADTYWGTSGFSVTDVGNLNNQNKLPFIFDVACVNGNFPGQTCFAESWLRAEKSGVPTGAIGIFASTINQDWNQPMMAQDEMIDILVETYADNIKRTFAGLAINGCFEMNDESSDWNMTDTWTVFGDPSLAVRTDNTSAMNIMHLPTIVVGSSNFIVNCDFNGAFACVSYNGTIIGTAKVIGGTAEVPISGITPGETLDVAVTGFNKITYQSQITVIAPTGPYIVLDNYSVNGGNSINYGETGNINITLKNVGPNDAVAVTASISTLYTGVTDIQNNIDIPFGNITANTGTSNVSDQFTFTVADTISDGVMIPFILTSTNGTDTWTSNLNIKVDAPKLFIDKLIIADGGNGILDPGETSDIQIDVINKGHASIENVIGQISTIGTHLTLNSVSTSPETILSGDTAHLIFNVTADPATVTGTTENIDLSVTGGLNNQYSALGSKPVVIGFVPVYCDASATTSTYEYISKVVCGTINNTSSSSSYTDFTNISTNVASGNTYPISVTVGSPYSSDRVICWIDWDYDGIFNETNEKISLTWTSPTAVGNIAVPTGIISRPVRMRIRLYDSGFDTPTACGAVNYGETEDYTLNILPNSSAVEEIEKSKIEIFPNPTNGLVNINFPKINSNAVVIVTNIQGQVILQKNMNNLTNLLDLSGFGKGIYFLKVNIDQTVEIKKIIVE
jgi:hypothetical protein